MDPIHELVSKMQAALADMINSGVVSKVRWSGLAAYADDLRPIITIDLQDQSVAAEISRLLTAADLSDVLWATATISPGRFLDAAKKHVESYTDPRDRLMDRLTKG